MICELCNAQLRNRRGLWLCSDGCEFGDLECVDDIDREDMEAIQSAIRRVKAEVWSEGYWACEQEGGGHNAANPYTEPAND